MNEDAGFVILLVALILFMPFIHFLGVEDGKEKGKNVGIVYCVEKPKECTISYTYLKLQENQK
jgi:hypothetical protein